MRQGDPNIEMLELVASGFGSLVDDVVFLGGCAAGFLVTDPASPPPRETKDVDVIVEVVSYHDYHDFSGQLKDRGFKEDTSDGAPMYRWVYQSLIVDVMPTKEGILGFSNKWYTEAMHTAEAMQLSNGVHIRMVAAPCFIATKLEAFYGRGENDYMASHDLEDLIAVLDGRASIVDEVMESSDLLRSYLAEEFTKLLGNDDFQDALPGHVPADAASQARVTLIQERMIQISNITQ